MAARLSQLKVNSLKPDPSKEYFEWDGAMPGLGVRVKPSGSSSYILQYRNKYGRTRRITLGKVQVLKLEAARRLAQSYLGDLAKGIDPSESRTKPKVSMSVEALSEQYLSDISTGRALSRGKRKSESTIATDRGRIRRHIIPLLGKRPANSITRSDVTVFMADVIEGKTAIDIRTGPRGRARVVGGEGTAAKAVSLLSAIFNYGIDRGLVDANPCLGVSKPRDKTRDRYLNPDELSRIGAAIREELPVRESRAALAAVVCLALSGCRRGEILGLKKQEIDVSAGALLLAKTKTGKQKRPCAKFVLEFMLHIASDIEADHIFSSSRTGFGLIDIRRTIKRLSTVSKVEGVTPHVFRHTFATVAHELGYTELTIAGLLGHSLGSVTSKYAHQVDTALQQAADSVAKVILDRLGLDLDDFSPM